jgi:membrane protease YdiL (CAAX protease family)
MKTSKSSGQSTFNSRSLKGLMRQHPLLFFFIMAYAFTWIMLIPFVLSAWGILPVDFSLLAVLSHFTGPTLAAIIMTGITEGKEGLHLLRQRLHLRDASWQWSLLILLSIPLLILLGIIVQPGVLASFQGFTPHLLVIYPVYFFAVFFTTGLPEEIGWRGFALPRMQPHYGPLWGTLLLGVLWVFWHLPLFLTPDHGGGPGTSFATFLINFSIFFLMIMALAVIFTWLFNHTGGNLFTAILAHTAIDTPQLVWIPLFLAVDETRLYLAILIGLGVLALLILILTRGRLGYQPGQEQTMEAKRY